MRALVITACHLQNSRHRPPKPSAHTQVSPSSALQSLTHLLCLRLCLFWTHHTNGIMPLFYRDCFSSTHTTAPSCTSVTICCVQLKGPTPWTFSHPLISWQVFGVSWFYYNAAKNTCLLGIHFRVEWLGHKVAQDSTEYHCYVFQRLEQRCPWNCPTRQYSQRTALKAARVGGVLVQHDMKQKAHTQTH